MIGTNGGQPRQITNTPAIDTNPHWSPDGRSLYFQSSRSGASEIWNVEASGGTPHQITRTGGFEAQPSTDGKFLYYTDRAPSSDSGAAGPARLMRVPADGGTPTEVVPKVWNFHWTVAREGVVYVSLDSPEDEVRLYRFRDEKTIVIAHLPFSSARLAGNISASLDGRWLIVPRRERGESDLMMIENFR